MIERLDGASFGAGFSTSPLTSTRLPSSLARLQNAVTVGLLPRHLGNRDDVAAGLVMHLRQLLHAGRVAQHQVVRQQDGESVIADERAGAPDRMAKAERHLLAHGGDRARRHRLGTQQIQRLTLIALGQRGFQLEGDVEMVDERGLAAAGDHAELLDTRRARLIHRILDQRLVHDGEHFLRHRLGRRQKSRAKSGDGKYGLTQRFYQRTLP